MTFFAHPQALIESGATIGTNSRVWAFVHILPGARIGSDCNICDHVFIENDVIIGDRVTVKCGVQLWDGLRVEDDVFIGPNATFTNDIFPRSKVKPEKFSETIVRKGASIGANATILPGLTIGPNAMIGAGAVVISSVPANAVVVGNPGVIVGYAAADKTKAGSIETIASGQKSRELGIGGARLVAVPNFRDLRGSLSVIEHAKDLPFMPKRHFFVYDVPSSEVRGEHAHKTLHQFLICVAGRLSVVVDDGRQRAEVALDSPAIGLLIPAGLWATQYKFSSDAVLAVMASDAYDDRDYIRDYQAYLAFKKI